MLASSMKKYLKILSRAVNLYLKNEFFERWGLFMNFHRHSRIEAKQRELKILDLKTNF